jgi:hypothetical protein
MTASNQPAIFPQLNQWRQVQRSYAAQPLEFCPDFPRIAARHEAWWRCELEGPPLFLATSSRDHSVPGGRRLDLLTQPEKWMAARLAQLKQTHLVGDALPTIRVDYGPVCLGMLMGAPVEFVSDSTWTHSFIREDWSNAPDWKIHADNPWWQLLPRLLRLNAENARGRYITMTPSLGGTADVLLNTRGADQLCLDLVDQPEKIETAVEKIYGTWREAYQILWGILMGTGVGTINWVGLWSDRPYHVLECDFNYLIGPTPFRQFFLPEITRQASAVGRSIFHLDGPGAARHIQSLLDTPEITAIQYVTGAGNSALAHLEMLKTIQQHGYPLQVTVPVQEAVELSRALDPSGLCLLVEGDLGPDGMDALYSEFSRYYSV